MKHHNPSNEPVTEHLDAIGRALGRIPSGLFVIAAHNEGKDQTMLASWIQQCSFQPPRLSIALAQGRGIGALLETGQDFTLSILPEGRKDLLSRFGKVNELPFEGVLHTRRGKGGAATIDEACAWFLCRSAGFQGAGDHDLLIADILDGECGPEIQGQPQRPAIHLRSSGLRY
ncbi:MAG: flavin reductase family protein [Gemmataceae bacterium]